MRQAVHRERCIPESVSTAVLERPHVSRQRDRNIGLHL
jgi:hypothetical protein